MTLSDQAWESDRPAVDQRYAPAPAVDAEDRVPRRHPKITPDRELEAAGDQAVTALEGTVDAARKARDHVMAVWDAKGGNKPAWKMLGDAGRALSGAGATLTAAADQV